jgi:hypothetical protein
VKRFWNLDVGLKKGKNTVVHVWYLDEDILCPGSGSHAEITIRIIARIKVGGRVT